MKLRSQQNTSIYFTSGEKSNFARPEPVPGFPTLCAVVFILVSDFEVRGGFVDIDGILSFGMLVLVTQMFSSDFPCAYWVSNCHCI
jgi:hypothetical protein